MDTSTSTFDRMTADLHLRDEAAGFLLHKLGRERHGAAWHDEGFRRSWLDTRDVSPSVVRFALKAATAPLDVSSGLAPSSPEARAFLAQVQRVSPLGQIGGITVRGGNLTGTIQTGNATASWAGEQASKPVTSLAFTNAAIRPLKLIAQVVVTKELSDLSVPDALTIVQRSLVSAAAAAEATALLDTAAAVAGVKPAGLLNGVSTITPAGDFANNIGQVLAALSGGDPSRPVLVVSFQTAVRMQAMLRDLRELGVRVVISSAAGSKVIGIDADGLLVTEGGIEIRTGQPDIQLDTVPTDPPVAATVMTSTWQRNLSVVRVERWVAWTARTGAVATLTLA